MEMAAVAGLGQVGKDSVARSKAGEEGGARATSTHGNVKMVKHMVRIKLF
jgi:hypothetical protein